MRIFGEEEYYPGPLWTPVIFDNMYPLTGVSPGDIYINRHRKPPLYYVFTTKFNCELVLPGEVYDWILNGWMSDITLDLPSGPLITAHSTRSKDLPHTQW